MHPSPISLGGGWVKWGMTFHVQAVDPDTGDEHSIPIHADSPESAAQWAFARGWVVGKVTSPPATPPAPQAQAAPLPAPARRPAHFDLLTVAAVVVVVGAFVAVWSRGYDKQHDERLRLENSLNTGRWESDSAKAARLAGEGSSLPLLVGGLGVAVVLLLLRRK